MTWSGGWLPIACRSSPRTGCASTSALTAHFGFWQLLPGHRKPTWVVHPDLLYGQLKKFRVYRKLKYVVTVGLCGTRQALRDRLQSLGYSGTINTAYIERFNLTLRQMVAPLTRKTWSLAQSPGTPDAPCRMGTGVLSLLPCSLLVDPGHGSPQGAAGTHARYGSRSDRPSLACAGPPQHAPGRSPLRLVPRFTLREPSTLAWPLPAAYRMTITGQTGSVRVTHPSGIAPPSGKIPSFSVTYPFATPF